MAQFTDITVLLDRSGSMVSIKSAMESAFDEFVKQHRAVPSSRLTLIQFDSENAQEVIYTAKPISDAPGLDLTPRGGTPLLDALCRAIDATGKRLGETPEAQRADQVLFVIITDGQENQSHEFKRADVRDRVTRQSGVYKWQFVYLGANQDAFAEAASFGIPQNHAMAYAANAAGTKAMGASLGMRSVSFTSRASAAVQDFDDDDRAAAMDKPKPKA